MENGAFAPKEQMLYFSLYFQILSILKASKGLIFGVKGKMSFELSKHVSQTVVHSEQPKLHRY